jgi:hypothetical protein
MGRLKIGASVPLYFLAISFRKAIALLAPGDVYPGTVRSPVTDRAPFTPRRATRFPLPSGRLRVCQIAGTRSKTGKFCRNEVRKKNNLKIKNSISQLNQ